MLRALCAVVFVVAMAGCSGNGGGHTLTGAVAAPQCDGIAGMSVTVRSESGAIIGATRTDSPTPTRNVLGMTMPGPSPCAVDFRLHVPAAKFYQLTVGSHAGPTYSHADLVAAGWSVALTVN